MKYIVVVGCQATKRCNVSEVQSCTAAPNRYCNSDSVGQKGSHDSQAMDQQIIFGMYHV